MLRNWIKSLNPTELRTRSAQARTEVTDRVDQARTEVTDRVDQARTEVTDRVDQAKSEILARRDWAAGEIHTARVHGKRRLWATQTDTLTMAVQALNKAPAQLDAVTAPITTQVDGWLTQLTDVGIDGYDSLNAKASIATLRDLDILGLERVARHERAHKGRKTVLDAIARQVELRLQRSAA